MTHSWIEIVTSATFRPLYPRKRDLVPIVQEAVSGSGRICVVLNTPQFLCMRADCIPVEECRDISMDTSITHKLTRVVAVTVEGQRCNTIYCCDVIQIRGRGEGGEILKGQREGRQWIGDEIL